jgi:uncharacterized membrane protein (UPF0127 family)
LRSFALFSLLLIACGDRVDVRVERAGAAVLEIRAEVAATADERRAGLRGHPPLGPDEGLLIVMPEPLEVCIVNDGVDFAIDAIYAADDGEVVAIERAIAAGDGTARCHPAVRRVLEVAAGVADPVAIGDLLVVD